MANEGGQNTEQLIGLKHVRDIAPYVGGKPISEVAREFGLDESKIVKLASNENPLGMPESAKKAMAKAAEDLGRYPDSNGFELKNALAKKLNVSVDWITLGNGSNDILELTARAVAQEGDEIVFSKHAFAVYPSGTFLKASEIEAFLQKVPNHVVVVIDEAYNEFLTPEQQYDAIAWVRKYPNVIVSRSFSKAYGLAGLRIGYGIAQNNITDLLNRIRQPFNVNSLAQAAAIAALADSAFLKKCYELNCAGYAQLTKAFDSMGLSYIPSSGNFVLVKVGEEPNAGAKVNLELLKAGVIVRPVGNYGLPQWLRISIGLPEENQIFIEALKKILGR
jgi:histidinol-phosphate aminotransferase